MPEDNVAQENISVNLPADCIYEIIQYVVDDVKTLYSCITLNQIFCQVAIRILWSNPFKYTQDEGKRSLIIRTYFSCLDDEEKNQITTFLRKNVLDFPKPFINYPCFLQEFEIYKIQESMRTFLRQYYSVPPTENRINSIVRILNPFMEELLFNNQSNFKYVNVNLNDSLSAEKNQMDISSFDDEVLSQVLSNINKFSLEFRYDYHKKKTEFFTFIKRNAETLTNVISEQNKDIQHVQFTFASQNFSYLRQNEIQRLKKINAEYEELVEILKSFILSLNNLTSLDIPCFWKHKDFFNLFKKHSHSLTYLKLHEIFNSSIVLNILNHCPNLKTIELVSFCFGNNIAETNSMFNKPVTSTLNHLENLYMTIPYASVIKLFEKIILMSNNSLKTLYYDKQQHYYSTIDDFNNITLSIQPFCTNLTHLCIKIFNERELSNTISFLKNVQQLVHLKLYFVCSHALKDDDISDLAHSFSPSLQILELDTFISDVKLKVLLQKVRGNLRKIYINTRINDAVLRIVMEYAKRRNSLKIFGYLNNRNNRYFAYELSSQVVEEATNLFTVVDNPEPFTTNFVRSIF